MLRWFRIDSRMVAGKGVEEMMDYIVPGLLFCVCAIALGKRENAYDVMLSGAGKPRRA